MVGVQEIPVARSLTFHMKYWLYNFVGGTCGGIRSILYEPACKCVDLLCSQKSDLSFIVDHESWEAHNFVFINKYSGKPLTTMYRVVTSTMFNYTGKMINPQLLRYVCLFCACQYVCKSLLFLHIPAAFPPRSGYVLITF
jgi:hypothetical protein